MRFLLRRAAYCLVFTGALAALGSGQQTSRPSLTKPDSPPATSGSAEGDQSFPTELSIRLHNADESKPWYQNLVVVGAAVAGLFAVVQLAWSLRVQRMERTRQHLLDSLHWFKGDTQPRSIGIAIVEANWKRHAFMREYWTRVLTTQAIHLLARSKEEDSRVEEANLDRIMTLITGADAELVQFDRDRLLRLLEERKDGRKLKSGGISLENLQSQVSKWLKDLGR